MERNCKTTILVLLLGDKLWNYIGEGVMLTQINIQCFDRWTYATCAVITACCWRRVPFQGGCGVNWAHC